MKRSSPSLLPFFYVLIFCKVPISKTMRTNMFGVDSLSSSLAVFRCVVLCSFIHVILTSFFKVTFQTMSEHHWTKQNWIRVVEYSCSKVSCPSEVPRCVRELIFKVIKEAKLICVRSIISCSRVLTKFQPVCINFIRNFKIL